MLFVKDTAHTFLRGTETEMDGALVDLNTIKRLYSEFETRGGAVLWVSFGGIQILKALLDSSRSGEHFDILFSLSTPV